MKSNQTIRGLGLGALLGDPAISIPMQEKVLMIPIAMIDPGPYQPRQKFSEESLKELELSIREQGVLLPILVRPKRTFEEAFQLVAGERRLRAAKMAGLNEIPALLRNWNDRQALEASILENVQREDLNPLELARGCVELIEKFGYSHKRTAQRIGKSRETITNLLRLLRLPESVQAMIESGALSTGHARALLRFEDKPELMERLASEIMVKELSVRQAESLARVFEAEVAVEQGSAIQEEEAGEGTEEEETGENPTEEPQSASRGRKRDPMILSIENRLTQSLGAQVTITHLRGKGKVILEYGTLDELESLANRLLKEIA